MPAQWITKSNGVEIRLNSSGDGKTRDIQLDLVTDDRYNDADRTRGAAAVKDRLQAELEVTQLVADLPDDDPDKTTDPARAMGERMFWRASDAGRLLVSRSTIVESVTWDGEKYRSVLRRAR